MNEVRIPFCYPINGSFWAQASRRKKAIRILRAWRVGYAIRSRVFCWDCGRIKWPWEATCRGSHRSCMHAQMRYTYSIYDRGVPMWECAWCGQIPT